MKPIIRLLLLIFICLIVYIPNAYSQDECPACPMNIEDIKKDYRFERSSYDRDDVYSLSLEDYVLCGRQGISCAYGKNGNLFIETPQKAGKKDGIKKEYYVKWCA